MLKAIIVDDEKSAISALTLLLEKHVGNVKVVGSATHYEKAIPMIETANPEIVFLDICMPGHNGFELLDDLKNKTFSIIFTSAHSHYAFQAIKHEPSDYLLKPIDTDELKAAIEKVCRRQEEKLRRYQEPRRLDMNARIGLPVREGLLYQPVADIIWIGSDGNYSTFHTSGATKLLVSRNIGEYEEMLPASNFFRAHKSHLINISKVKKYIRTDGYYVEMEDGSILEIARRKKDEFLKIMNNF